MVNKFLSDITNSISINTRTIIIIVLLFLILYLLYREVNRNFTEKSFISIVNHTFRTPLTRMKWMSENLTKSIPLKEQVEIADNLSNSVNRLLEIIDILSGIKDIYSTSTYNLKAVSIREILEGAIKKYKTTLNERKINLLLPTFVDMPLLTFDVKKISFVINVMIENAIFYSKENGSIKISSELKNNALILSVEDNGIGLSWKDRWNLFKRFYRGRRAQKMNTEGMGLGLYISNEIIRRHHGKISAKSKGKDKGAIFSIKLPTNN